MDPELVSTIEAVAHEAFNAERFQEGMKERGFGAVWLGAEDFAAFIKQHEEQTQRVMSALGTTEEAAN